MADPTDDAINSHLKVQLGHGYFVPQLVALTQDTINHNLRVLYNTNEELKTVKVSRGSTSMEATTKAGQISIPVNDDAGKSVFYHCRFISGNAKLPSESGSSIVDVNLKDWEFVFAVDIGSIKMDSGSKRDKVAKDMDRVGDFDILQLFLDFTKNQIHSFERSMSNFQGKNLQGSQLQAFLDLMNEWANAVAAKAREDASFFYVLRTQQADKVSPGAPMFAPPDLLAVQTYPYKTPKTGKTESGLTAAGNLNMLLFLLGSNSVPNPSRSLRWMGNLVMEGVPGNVCMSRGVMWDSFLLRRTPSFLLNDVLFLMCPYACIDHLKLSEGSNNYPKVDFKVNFGINKPDRPRDGSTYSWAPNGWTGFWKWTRSDSDKTSSELGQANSQLEATWRSSFFMEHKPGTNVVRCFGTSDYFMYLSVYNMNSRAEYGSAEIQITMKWVILFAFIVNDDGVLLVNVDFPKNEYSLEGKVNKEKGFEATKFKDDMMRQFGEAREGVLNRLQNECVKQLRLDIARVHQFTLPGSGTFTYKNAVWTNNGDLMVDINYLQGT